MLASRWANEAENVPVSGGLFSAFHWYRKTYLAAQTVLSGLAGIIHSAASKVTLSPSDEFAMTDSATSFGLKKITSQSLRAWILGDGATSAFRNKIIDGDFNFWQSGVSFTPNGYGYTADMAAYNRNGSGATVTVSRQEFPIGQTDVPGNPTYFYQVEQSVAGTGATINNVWGHPIEDVRTLSGKKATLTFYARTTIGSVPLLPQIAQVFGSGGSPSAEVVTVGTAKNLTTSWQRFDYVFDVPSIGGKTLGSNGNSCLFVLLEAVNKNAIQTVQLARISFVPGDATAESDPAGTRSPQQEALLVQRFFRFIPNFAMYPMSSTPSTLDRRRECPLDPPMRTTPLVTYTPAAEVTSHAVDATMRDCF